MAITPTIRVEVSASLRATNGVTVGIANQHITLEELWRQKVKGR